MLEIKKLPGLLEPRINLGNQNENDTKIIQIDVSAWDALYPGCTYHITAMRPGDAGNWPVTGVSHTDGVLTWVVPNTVTSVPGRGSLVIHCMLDGKEKNTGTFGYSVSPGHASMGEAPDPVADWIDDANAKLDEVDESIERTNAAEDLRETAETARETAEGLRAGAETSRNTAEGLRLSAETARNSAEGLRGSAETDRREAEALRVAAEAVRMGFKPMGAYNPANENKYGEWYTHEGGSYGYIRPEPSTGVPLTDTSHWQQIAAKGDIGPQGEQGLKGDPGEVTAAELAEVTSQLADKTSYGVLNGLVVAAQNTPNMTVKVSAGVAYMSNNTRYAPAAVASLAVTAADATNPRKDIVYLSSAGVVTYLAGTAAATPAAPATPAGGLLLAEISVAANQTTVAKANIALRKKGLWTEDWITPTFLNGWQSDSHNGFVGMRYTKDAMGFVHVEGGAYNASSNSNPSFTLASGFRPSEVIVVMTTPKIRINTNGDVFCPDTGNGIRLFITFMPS